jgi:hypothetical protein
LTPNPGAENPSSQPGCLVKQAVPMATNHACSIEQGDIHLDLPPYGYQWISVLETEAPTFPNQE